MLDNKQEQHTWHSLDFLDVHFPEESRANGDGVRVGIFDFGRELKPSENDEFDTFSRLPKVKAFCKCKRKNKKVTLNKHGFICASVISGKSREVDFYHVCEGQMGGVSPDVDLYMYAFGCGTTTSTCAACEQYIGELLTLCFDEAIRDGVHILSLSISQEDHVNRKFEEDRMGLKTLEALKANVLSCVSAGNTGPNEGSIRNPYPWCLTVGACSSGKILKAVVEIGTTRIVLPPDEILRTELDGNTRINVLHSFNGDSLNIIDSGFRTVRFRRSTQYQERFLVYNAKTDTIDLVPPRPMHTQSVGKLTGIPSKLVAITEEQSIKLWDLLEKFHRVYARICISQFCEDEVFIPNFSSRGPAKGLFSQIIKPDLVAPGYAVLSSHPRELPLVDEMVEIYKDQTISDGTSISTPHVAALAAVICSHHPTWTPSMIKSALMTTAWKYPENGLVGKEFCFGAGIPRLKRALHPGLVYDESWESFDQYLKKRLSVHDLNIPSFCASFDSTSEMCQDTFHREIMNVGAHEEDSGYVPVHYVALVEIYDNFMGSDLEITVEPQELLFEIGERKKFKLTVKLTPEMDSEGYVSAALIWVPYPYGDTSEVYSPIHLYKDLFKIVDTN